MKNQSFRRVSREILPLLFLVLLSRAVVAEPITLKHAVELALKHATAGDIATADEQRAAASYRELRDTYIPQLSTGTALGWSYGFPLGLAGSAPALFNLNAQSALLDPSLRNFIRAARADAAVASFHTKDQRDQTIQDTVLTYAELSKWEQRLSHLQETQAAAENMQTAETERVKEGIDSEVENTKARLSVARVRLRITEAQGSADVLRDHLSRLTGLPANGIQTEPDSVPAVPAPAPESVRSDNTGGSADLVSSNSTSSNPSIGAALEHTRAQYLRAQAEHKALWPSVDFGAQYAVLSKFNNYQHYYIPATPCALNLGNQTPLCEDNSFRQNNATVGVSIRFPIFNATQRARAQAADADALKAKKQSEAARDQVSEETLKLRRSVAQLQAARDVAQLESEIAEKDLQAVQTRVEAGTATPHDLDDARTQASERFIALQDVSFELERSQVGLLRANGDLESWALGAR